MPKVNRLDLVKNQTKRLVHAKEHAAPIQKVPKTLCDALNQPILNIKPTNLHQSLTKLQLIRLDQPKLQKLRLSHVISYRLFQPVCAYL